MFSSSGVERSAKRANPDRMSTTSWRTSIRGGSLVRRLLFHDRPADRLVHGPGDAGGVEAVLAQYVRALALGEEGVGQGEHAHATRQAMRGEGFEDGSPEASGADVVLDRDNDGVGARPV